MSKKLSVQLTAKQIKNFVAKGMLDPSAVKEPKSRQKPLVDTKIVSEGPDFICFQVGIRTASEANARAWRERSQRSGHAKASICKVMGKHAAKFAKYAEHWHGGGSLHLSFLRLGCHRVDEMANLGPTMKASEDAVAMWLGADDRDPRNWKAEAHQDTLSKHVGVMVTIRIV